MWWRAGKWRTHQRCSKWPAWLSSLFLRVPPRWFPADFVSVLHRQGVKGHKNGAGRPSLTPLAAFSASAGLGCPTLDSRFGRRVAAVGWTLLLLPPPPRLGSGPVSSSLLGLRGLGAACSSSSASPAQPSGTPHNPSRFPFLPSANLQHRGAAPAAPENQDDHPGVLQPHQLDSDSNLLLPYLGLFRPRVQHCRILRGSEAGLFISLQIISPPLMHSTVRHAEVFSGEVSTGSQMITCG